jgi:hypothetical protein
MKTIFAIGIIITTILTLGFTASESSKYQAPDSTARLTVEVQNALPSEANTATIPQNGQHAQDGNSIFSWWTMVSLSMAVVGIVAFRRNTYS